MSAPTPLDIPAPDSIILDRALRILVEIGMSQPPHVIREYNRRAAALKDADNESHNLDASAPLEPISHKNGNGNGRTAARRPRPHQRTVNLDKALRPHLLRGEHDPAGRVDSKGYPVQDKP